MSKHWIENLPEVGAPILKKLDVLLRTEAEIERVKQEMESEIKRLTEITRQVEKEIMTSVEKNWTPEEVSSAKLM